MRFPRAAAVLLGAAAVAAGCSREEETVPAACLEGAQDVRVALREAPGRVRLDGTPLSDCIKDTSGGGDLHDVGQAWVSVAAELADEAALRPNGDAALQLGYLVGALRRGEFGAQGVGHELSRRLAAELARVDVRSTAFRRGERAGRAHG